MVRCLAGVSPYGLIPSFSPCSFSTLRIVRRLLVVVPVTTENIVLSLSLMKWVKLGVTVSVRSLAPVCTAKSASARM